MTSSTQGDSHAAEHDLMMAVMQNVPWSSSLMLSHCPPAKVEVRETVKLSETRFTELAGSVSGQLFVKIVVDRRDDTTHFLDHNRYEFHVNYISEVILGRSPGEVDAELDRFNESIYFSDDRRFLLGVLSRHERGGAPMFVLETVEVDTMGPEMVRELYRCVAAHLPEGTELRFKPSNHHQEQFFREESTPSIPVIWPNELYELKDFVPLNLGAAKGRLRVFTDLAQYRTSHQTLGLQDIVVMARIPDDIPRVAGVINAEHTTPLSHSNVLAHGWQIPNAVQRGIIARIDQEGLRDQWVLYRVDANAAEIHLERLEPSQIPDVTFPSVPKVHLEAPDIDRSPIKSLEQLRMSTRYRYGTKAANLGELSYVLNEGSTRLLGFYRIPRPPRPNLLPYLARYLNVPNDDRLADAALHFLKQNLRVPRGIAVPFAFQDQFVKSSPQIQQHLGRLKMALEMDAPVVPKLCEELQEMIITQRMPASMRDYLDSQIVEHLAGTSSFVVRSSSNAEDLDNFSAAGLYESRNAITTAENLFESIKQVWASLLTYRSVRMRHAAGISLDDTYMGVVIQEEIEGELGGVLVTTNPTEPTGGFRNVFINASHRSVNDVVNGDHAPYQLLYNTVEGGGRTLSAGSDSRELTAEESDILQRLAFAGRLLQSHFANDYTFATPLDIEWILRDGHIYVLQARPYALS